MFTCLYRCVMREYFSLSLVSERQTGFVLPCVQTRCGQNILNNVLVSVCVRCTSSGSAVDRVCVCLAACLSVCMYDSLRVSDSVCLCYAVHVHTCGPIYESCFDTVMLACVGRTYCIYIHFGGMQQCVRRMCISAGAVCLYIQARQQLLDATCGRALPPACCGSK